MYAAYVEVAMAWNSSAVYIHWDVVRIDPGLKWQHDAFMAMARLAIVELRSANVIVVPHGPIEPLGDLKLFPCIGGQELGQGGDPVSVGVVGAQGCSCNIRERNFIGLPGGYEVPHD